jgi:hypothetical protein
MSYAMGAPYISGSRDCLGFSRVAFARAQQLPAGATLEDNRGLWETPTPGADIANFFLNSPDPSNAPILIKNWVMDMPEQ